MVQNIAWKSNVKSGEWSNELDAYEVKDGEFAGFCAIGVEPLF